MPNPSRPFRQRKRDRSLASCDILRQASALAESALAKPVPATTAPKKSVSVKPGTAPKKKTGDRQSHPIAWFFAGAGSLAAAAGLLQLLISLF